MIAVTIESQCYRDQFDEWVACGTFDYEGKTYQWFANNDNCGRGWNIQPSFDEDWDDITEDQVAGIVGFIERGLYEHRTQYVF